MLKVKSNSFGKLKNTGEVEDLTPNSHLRVNTPVQLATFQFTSTKGKMNIREAFTFSFQQIQFETSIPSEQLNSYRYDYVYIFIVNEINLKLSTFKDPVE